MRPCDSVSGTRCTRCVPPSHLKTEYAPSPLTAKTTSLKPPRLALVGREELGLEAAPLRVAGEHAVDVAGPERRLVPAHALPDLDDDVLRRRPDRFSTSASFSSSSSSRRRRLELGDELGAARGRRAPPRGRPAPARHSCASLCARSSSLSRRPTSAASLAVVVDRRVGHALLRLRVGALELLDQLLDRPPCAPMLAAAAGRERAPGAALSRPQSRVPERQRREGHVRGLSPDASRADVSRCANCATLFPQADCRAMRGLRSTACRDYRARAFRTTASGT